MKTIIYFLELVNLIKTIVSKDIHFVTQEELPENTFVGDLKSHVNLENIETLKISNVKPEVSDYFFLEKSVLRIKRTIDREATCLQSEKDNECVLNFVLIYGMLSKPMFLNVLVTVLDINDNPPQFTESEIEHVVVENANPMLSDLYLHRAEDPDRLENGTVTYKLRTKDDKMSPQNFRLQISPDNTPKLIQLRKLDYEKKSFYLMELIATDGGYNSKTGTLQIKIKVQDENDNAPLFEKSKYEKTINEDISVNENILEISAKDSDSGENGKVTYKLASATTPIHKTAYSYFGVRTFGDKGNVYVKNKIDVDGDTQINSLEFTVLACDNGYPQLCNRANVLIRILDINDFRPLISVTYLYTPGINRGSSVIKENSVNNYIAVVIVTDRDSGSGGIVECSLNNPNFELNQGMSDIPSSGELGLLRRGDSQKYFHIKNIKQFDREETDVVRFKITCRDNPNFQKTPFVPIQLSSEAEIVVYIEDENDNPPEFSRSPYKFSVLENRPQNSEKQVRLGSVDATDKDIQNDFTYSLDLNPSQSFELSQTGVLYLVKPFDRERLTVNPIQIVVSVTDGKFNTSTGVSILVQDENDMEPNFAFDTYRFSVVEHSYSNFIGSVEATDQDTPDFGPIEYRIAPPSHFFSIDSVSGMIRISTQLDREVREYYTLRILAIDNRRERGAIRKTGSTTVSVTVLDINDNYPQIDSPQPQKTLSINPLWPVGQKVLTVKANDPDLMENGTITYKIIKDGLGLFNIDSKSGDLFLTKKLSENENHIINSHLVITASDNGIPLPKSTTVSLMVKMSTENAPDINEPSIDNGYNNEKQIEKSNKKTLIIIVIIALALIVTIVMTIIIVIHQARLPPPVHMTSQTKRSDLDTQGKFDLYHSSDTQSMEKNFSISLAKNYYLSSSTLQRKDDKSSLQTEMVTVDPHSEEYQQLMTTPTLMRIWHNNLNQYNDLIPPECIPQLKIQNANAASSSRLNISPKINNQLSETHQKNSTENSELNNYLQSSFV